MLDVSVFLTGKSKPKITQICMFLLIFKTTKWQKVEHSKTTRRNARVKIF